MRLLGYTRVSKVTEDARLQTDALMSAGVLPDDVMADVIAGSKVASDRPGMRAVVEHAVMGDAVVVWRIDRLGRSLSEVLDTVTMLVERGLNLLSVQDGIDSRTATGRLMVDLLASLAGYERHLTCERIAAGMASARKSGTRLGRPPVEADTVHEKLRVVDDARARGLTAADAAQLVGWSRATFYRHQQRNGPQG